MLLLIALAFVCVYSGLPRDTRLPHISDTSSPNPGCDDSALFIHPGSLSFPFSWDVNGTLYVYGGVFYTGVAIGYASDLYSYNDSKWVYHATNGRTQGSPDASPMTVSGSDVYASTYHPGVRHGGLSFVVGSELFLLMGRQVRGVNWGFANDVWKCRLSDYYWAYRRGVNPNDDFGDATGQYSTEAAFSNRYTQGNYNPGGRRFATGWLLDNKIYMFGGIGWDGGVIPNWNNNLGFLNDMWIYSISSNTWEVAVTSVDVDQNVKRAQTTYMDITGRWCSNSNKGSSSVTPPCYRASALGWTYQSKLYLFGGHMMLKASSAVRSDYLRLFYNDLWTYEPAQKAASPWVWVGGEKPIVEPLFGSDVINPLSTIPSSTFYNTYLEHAQAWPGGLTTASVWDYDSYVLVYGGYGYGTWTTDYQQMSDSGSDSYHCKYYVSIGGGGSGQNETCGALRDFWAFDKVSGQWAYIEGDASPEWHLGTFLAWYSSLGQFGSGNPLGRAGAVTFKHKDGAAFYGGGAATYFQFPDPAADPMRAVFSDAWVRRMYSCGGKVYLDPTVCSGSARGTCESQDTCNCGKNFEGDNCETQKYDTFTCGGLEPDHDDVCNGHGICETMNDCTCSGGWSGADCDGCITKNCTGYDGATTETPFDWTLVAYIGGGVIAGVILLLVVGVLVLVIVANIVNRTGGTPSDASMKTYSDGESEGEWTDGEEEEEGEWTDDDDYV